MSTLTVFFALFSNQKHYIATLAEKNIMNENANYWIYAYKVTGFHIHF